METYRLAGLHETKILMEIRAWTFLSNNLNSIKFLNLVWLIHWFGQLSDDQYYFKTFFAMVPYM